MEIKLQIGDRLKKIREMFGDNQVQFAKKLKVTAGALSKYEKGSLGLPDEIKLALIQMGISPYWIFTGKGDMLLAPATIGERLRKVREDTKISVESIAKVLGITQETYYQFERNELEPTDEQLREFGKLMNRDFGWLKNGHTEQGVMTRDTFRSLFPDVTRMLDENIDMQCRLGNLYHIEYIWEKLDQRQRDMVVAYSKALLDTSQAKK